MERDGNKEVYSKIISCAFDKINKQRRVIVVTDICGLERTVLSGKNKARGVITLYQLIDRIKEAVVRDNLLIMDVKTRGMTEQESLFLFWRFFRFCEVLFVNRYHIKIETVPFPLKKYIRRGKE